MIYIGNTFTCNFLSQLNCNVNFQQISWDTFDEFLNGEFVNFMGHEGIARLVGLEKNRISISANTGDIIVFAQYKGPRLPEEATELPADAEIIPVMAIIS